MHRTRSNRARTGEKRDYAVIKKHQENNQGLTHTIVISHTACRTVPPKSRTGSSQQLQSLLYLRIVTAARHYLQIGKRRHFYPRYGHVYPRDARYARLRRQPQTNHYFPQNPQRGRPQLLRRHDASLPGSGLRFLFKRTLIFPLYFHFLPFYTRNFQIFFRFQGFNALLLPSCA